MGARIAALAAILDELANAVRAALADDWDFQVEPWMVVNPTPPTIDIFPGEPPTDEDYAAFGDLEGPRTFTVRARVGTADTDAGRDVLLSLMDVQDDHSIVRALEDDQTLNGLATQVDVRGGLSLAAYLTPDGIASLLGVQWTVLVLDIDT